MGLHWINFPLQIIWLACNRHVCSLVHHWHFMTSGHDWIFSLVSMWALSFDIHMDTCLLKSAKHTTEIHMEVLKLLLWSLTSHIYCWNPSPWYNMHTDWTRRGSAIDDIIKTLETIFVKLTIIMLSTCCKSNTFHVRWVICFVEGGFGDIRWDPLANLRCIHLLSVVAIMSTALFEANFSVCWYGRALFTNKNAFVRCILGNGVNLSQC